MRPRCPTLIAVLVAAYPVCAWAHTDSPLPRGKVLDETYDFGSVKQGSLVTHTFAISNTGAARLRVAGVTLSMSGMKVRVTPADLPAAGVGIVALELSTETLAGKIDGEAQIHWNDPTQPVVSLKVKGMVIPPITIEPIPAIFISTYSDEPAERSLTVKNNEARPIAITTVEHSQRLAVSVANVEAGRLFVVTARSEKGTPVGRYEESLTLVTDKPGENRIELPVHLWVKPDLYANPEAIDFGNVRIEELGHTGVDPLLTQTFFVKRRGGSFEITSIDCDSGAVLIERSPKGSSDSFQIDVRLNHEALSPGNITGRIRVTTTDSRYPEIVIPLTGTIN